MITFETKYTGELRTEATHIRSGKKIITDAPVDNKGKGESFSPTDLVAGTLGSCMLTIIGIKASEHGFNINGTRANITKVMASNPRRISEIIIEFDFPDNNYSKKEKQLIINSAKTCPVAKSIHPDINQSVKFNF
jgi:uncharacterized OsmC-like protein